MTLVLAVLVVWPALRTDCFLLVPSLSLCRWVAPPSLTAGALPATAAPPPQEAADFIAAQVAAK